MKKIILLILLISQTSLTFAECKNSNVYEDIACYEKELKENKTKLNQTYKKLYDSLEADAQPILENAQKNWLKYKNTHCDELVAHVSGASLGAGARLINLSCNADLTEERIKQLKDLP